MGSNSNSIHGMILKPDVSRSSVLDAIMVNSAAAGSPAGAAGVRPDRGIGRRAQPQQNRKAWQDAVFPMSPRGPRRQAVAGFSSRPPADQSHGQVADLPVAGAVALSEVARRRQKRGDHPSRNVARYRRAVRRLPLRLRTAPQRTRFLREPRTHPAKLSARSFATVTHTRWMRVSGRGTFRVCSRLLKRQCGPGHRSGKRVERSDGQATMAAITSRPASTARSRRSTILRRMPPSTGAAIVGSRTSGRGTSVPVGRWR